MKPPFCDRRRPRLASLRVAGSLQNSLKQAKTPYFPPLFIVFPHNMQLTPAHEAQVSGS
jgi:hypothetical protein